jgi:hypothetical protein
VSERTFTITEDDDGFWLREHATGELCGPYDTRVEAIADRRDESNERTFIAYTQANCFTTERWRVRVPADTPDDELEAEVFAAVDANGDFLDEKIDGEEDRTLLRFEEDIAPASAPAAATPVRRRYVGGHVVHLSDEAMAVLAGFAHLDTDQHQYIYARDETWDELKRAFPKARFDARCAQDPNFYEPEVW